jgi:hypothetical protein
MDPGTASSKRLKRPWPEKRSARQRRFGDMGRMRFVFRPSVVAWRRARSLDAELLGVWGGTEALRRRYREDLR